MGRRPKIKHGGPTGSPDRSVRIHRRDGARLAPIASRRDTGPGDRSRRRKHSRRSVSANNGSGVSRSATADVQGRSVLANLPAGAYTVRVSAKGFAQKLRGTFLLCLDKTTWTHRSSSSHLRRSLLPECSNLFQSHWSNQWLTNFS